MAEMSVIIDRQDGLGFHGIPWEEAVVQAVLFCVYNLQAQGEILLSNNISALDIKLWLVKSSIFYLTEMNLH